MLTLLVIGIGLIFFGAIVLLKFPNRPGGKIAWGSFHVSSLGAGLPLIALGVACLIIYALQAPAPVENGRKPANSSVDIAIEEVPASRITTLETGASDVTLVGPAQSKDAPFVVHLTENRKSIGFIQFSFYSSNQFFRVEQITGADGEKIRTFRNASRGGERNVLQNWDTLEFSLAKGTYALRVGYDGGVISVNYFRKLSG